MKTLLIASVLTVAAAAAPSAQQPRPLSPLDTASTIVGGQWTRNAQGREVYEGGKWIEVTYSRPMLRQRENIFGSGADYGKAVRAGTPVWRAGANSTTLFRTDAALAFEGGGTLPAGEYGMLVDLKGEKDWTLIFTSQPRQKEFDPNNKTELNGATNYDPKFDALRVKMNVSQQDMRVDQLTMFFVNVTKDAGGFGIAWDRTIAGLDFKVAPGTAGAPAAAPAQPAPQRAASPPGIATAMLGGDWVKNAEGNAVYESGKWIEVRYNRPMLRQRANIFGAGADYGKTVLAGAPVWRVGANQSTRIKTDVPLVFGTGTLPAGEYSMFVDLKEGAWTLIFSNWPPQQKYNADDKTALWGAYNYTPDKDALRVPMQTDGSGVLWPSIDQLTIFFCDVQKESGKLVIAWDKTVAFAPFTAGK